MTTSAATAPMQAEDDLRSAMGTDVTGTAVLVHGLWGDPDDWFRVRSLLEAAGVGVVTPDLPSHRRATAGLLEDADEVGAAIRAAAPPVVVAGWSYGGTVVSIAAEGVPGVTRLVYVSNVPGPVREHGYTDWIDTDPAVIVRPDETFVLDDDWWLDEEAGTTFSPEVQRHLRAHPRRPVSRKSMSDPQPAAAWLHLPTTVVLGEHDDQPGADDLEGLAAAGADVRVVDCDHFTIFRTPEPVARAVLDGLGTVAG